MKERPILFSAPMVKALLAGTKTQTRRLVKPGMYLWEGQSEDDCEHIHQSDERFGAKCAELIPCPHGERGDRLWVKETFSPCAAPALKGHIHYRADGAVGLRQQTNGGDSWWARSGHTLGLADKTLQGVWVGPPKKWKPSIFMTRKASRITLEVTSVRVERLQAISEEDAKAEGVEPAPFTKAGRPSAHLCVEAFEDLWGEINGAESWAANPWVWVVEFRRVTP